MNNIRFKTRCEIELADDFDGVSDSLGKFNQIFNEGEEYEVDITREGPTSIDIQFGDGSMAYNVWFDLVEIIV